MTFSGVSVARSVTVLVLAGVVAIGCGGGTQSEDADVDDGSVKQTADAAPNFDGGTTADGAATVCPLGGFSPCGGNIEGSWKLRDFCDLEGHAASRPRACDGPGGTRPACQGASNAGTCWALYRVTADIGPAEIVLTTGLFAATLHTLDNACLAAIGGSAAPSDACVALGKPERGLTCSYRFGQCRCEGTSTEPLQAGTDTFPYRRDGNRLTLRPGPDMATGTYCVAGDQLSIQFDQVGFQGWRSWILEK